MVQRDSRCPELTTSENTSLAQKPGLPNGKLRPCGPLLQLVVVALLRIHSISRSVDSVFSEAEEQSCNTTYF
jgi:hypothetical protein